MPEATVVVPEVFISPTPLSPRKRLIIFSFVVFIIIAATVSVFYYIDQKNRTIDVLALSGWYQYTHIAHLPDNSIQVSVSNEETERLTQNKSDYIEVGPKGFDVQVKMSSVSKTDSKTPRASNVNFYNSSVTKDGKKPTRIQIGIDGEGFLEVIFVDLNQNDPTERSAFLVERFSIRPSSDELKIKFRILGEKDIISIYGKNNQILAENIELPAPFFNSEPRKLYFGVYPQSTEYDGVIMTVGNFKITKL